MSVTPAARTAPRLQTEQQALDAARAYANSIEDGAIRRDRDGAVPYEELARFDASGLLGITVPAEHGGGDLSSAVMAEIVRIIASVDPAIAQIPQSHFLMVDVLSLWGTPYQQETIFSDVIAGGRIGNALAERGGRHAQDLKTRVRRSGLDLRLSGVKYYCTGSISSEWIGVSALDEEDRLVMVFVRRQAEGVTIDEDWNVMGQRATVSGTTTLDDVEVDPALVVPYRCAFEGPQQIGARAQLYHAAIEVGIAGGAVRDACRYVQSKARPFFEAVQAGKATTAGDDPYTIGHMGRMATRVVAAEQLLRWAAETQAAIGRQPADDDEAARGSLAVAQAKAFASETAVEVSSELFSMSGASAADERYDLSRHWRNARTHSSHDPVDWKYHHVGNYLLNHVLPPRHGQL